MFLEAGHDQIVIVVFPRLHCRCNYQVDTFLTNISMDLLVIDQYLWIGPLINCHCGSCPFAFRAFSIIFSAFAISAHDYRNDFRVVCYFFFYRMCPFLSPFIS